MFVTMLEARVEEARVADLERAYAAALLELPSEIVETFLVRDTDDPSQFRIFTVWKDRESLVALRKAGVTPKGLQIFHAAGAKSRASLLDVIASSKA